MSSKKNPKKRNKVYRGKDAKPQGPVIHRYEAINRGPIKEWWHDHKKQVKIVSYIVGGVIIFVWLLIELVRLIA